MNSVELEYQQAQRSAEHHNRIMWTLIHMGIGLSLIIFYTMLRTEGEIAVEVKMAILSFGAFVLFYFNKIIEKSNKTKNYMYNICQKIEDETPEFRHKIHKGTKRLHQKEKLESLAVLRLGIFLLFLVYLIGMIYLEYNKLFSLFQDFSIYKFDIIINGLEVILFLPFVFLFLILEIVKMINDRCEKP